MQEQQDRRPRRFPDAAAGAAVISRWRSVAKAPVRDLLPCTEDAGGGGRRRRLQHEAELRGRHLYLHHRKRHRFPGEEQF